MPRLGISLRALRFGLILSVGGAAPGVGLAQMEFEGEVPFTATWGGTPRSQDRVNIRPFLATVSPQWGPAVSDPKPAEGGVWVRYEDAHGPGWVGYLDGQLWVE